MSGFRSRWLPLLALTGLIGTAATFTLARPAPDDPKPSWIWAKSESPDGEVVNFRKTFEVPAGVVSAKLVASCDNGATVYLDNKIVASCQDWAQPVPNDVTALLKTKTKKHALSVAAKNDGGPAGFLLRIVVKTKDGKSLTIVTDESWKCETKAVTPGSGGLDFDDSKWANAKIVAPLGGGPWNSVTLATLDTAEKHSAPQAPAASSFKVAKGFKVERLYTVPKDEQGSWVNMTPLPDGRLIVSDQYGKLYTVTPPKIGGSPDEIKVEAIDIPLGEAQGLLWAFDALYVVVNRGQSYESGLYRVTDKNKDGKLDTVELLRKIEGGGEHGPHAVVLAPDGKSLYVIAGNATKLPQLSGSLVPKIYDEDQILPYMTDGNGFMADERAPGGWICRVTPDGKDWTLFSMGYRTPFDLAFNRYGDLFTYDSDMEWDINTPWYRPTRVCQADSGADLGYRNGSGKWPTYYPDSLPQTVNIGPGSPTGVAFGYGTKFPAKYQEALFISDWSYGKLYAVLLSPDQSHYKAELEEFITGSPLPLTDVVVNPKDQALYFAIGGRKTLSGLYRVTYAGDESTETDPGTDFGAELRAVRKSLEAFHGKKDPKAVDAAWPYLGHSDRYIRYAARVAIEWQPVSTWQQKALDEVEPNASLTALLALARVGDKSLQKDLLKELGEIDFLSLPQPQKLEALRVLELAIIRMGELKGQLRDDVIAKLNDLYPAKSRELNAELAKLMIALEAPTAASKTMDLLAKAPTQEEQMEYVTALRKLKTGWTPELRKTYFSWFNLARTFRGGPSLGGFLRQMKNDALATVSPEEKLALKPILEAPATAATPVFTTRPLVKTYTLDELAPLMETGLKNRDFDRGRSLFGAATCFNCHRYDNEGGSVGPDLTGLAGRFSARDLLESIVMPSKSISDQYQATTFAMTDGRVITGRVANLNGDNIMVITNMLDPGNMVGINRNQIDESKPSPVSMMPEGLLNSLKQDEILDLMAYLLSRGDRNHPMFK